jgi:hypothetical protein
MTIADTLPSAKARRKLVTNFVNTLDNFNGIKLNAVSRRTIVKHLVTLSAISHDEKAINEYKKQLLSNPTSEEISKTIQKLEKSVKKMRSYIYGVKRYIPIAIVAIIGVVSAALGGGLPVLGFALGWAGTWGAIDAVDQIISHKLIENYKRGDYKDLEEHWCDMFASMYNLPITFFIGHGKMAISPDDMSIDQIKKWNRLEKEATELTLGTYPTTLERCHSAVKYAKKTLDSGVQLDPSIKKYLEWIVETFSGTLELDIDTIYNKATFDPKTAEDLDLHIDHLINRGNIQVTESDFSWLNTLGENDTILD